MAGKEYDDLSWLKSKEDIITLENRSRTNYILDLPTGLYRLDSGRRMRTLRSILKIAQVQKLIDAGEIVITT
jgi:hypothetical protein